MDAAAITPSLACAGQRTDDKPRNEMYILNFSSFDASDSLYFSSIEQNAVTNLAVGKRRYPYQGHELLP
jgi:hypothetical protein